jgi:DNA alkylation repair enzyme
VPAIDLGRLRKQAARLIDFFFLPDEFTRQLHSLLDSYLDYTKRRSQAAAPGTNLPTHRTPAVVLQQIQQELSSLAASPANADAALALADRLWDEGWLETRLLAGFLLGRMAPQEGRLIARLSAWTAQTRDVELRSKLLDASLSRTRKEAPALFLQLLQEWMRPERVRYWGDAMRASIAALADPTFAQLPALLNILEPVFLLAPVDLQLDLEELILSLYRLSPAETTYLLERVLASSDDPATVIAFRRMLPAFPPDLRAGIRELVRRKASPAA